jgi:hypothetical protein
LISTAEVTLVLGDTIGVVDALERLHRARLVHRLGDFLWLTCGGAWARDLAI